MAEIGQTWQSAGPHSDWWRGEDEWSMSLLIHSHSQDICHNQLSWSQKFHRKRDQANFTTATTQSWGSSSHVRMIDMAHLTCGSFHSSSDGSDFCIRWAVQDTMTGLGQEKLRFWVAYFLNTGQYNNQLAPFPPEKYPFLFLNSVK
jgi:hypothetical protein